MKKLFLFLTAALFSTGAWAVDIVPSFVEGYTTVQVVSTTVDGFGDVYFGSRTAITKNTPSGHTNYRTPKGDFVFELTEPSTISLTFYATSSGRSVSVGLYTMDDTMFSVWERAAGSAKNFNTWVIDNKDKFAADGETTLDAYFKDGTKLKLSSGEIASSSDNEKALLPEATYNSEGLNDYASKLYTKYWRHASAESLTQNSPTIVNLNDGNSVPAGKYLMTIGDNSSNMGIEKITITSATTYSITYALNGGTGTTPTQSNKAAGATFTLHDGVTGITAPTGKEFEKWKDQDDALFNGGATYTMPAKNVTLTAQWRDPAPKYTVTYVLNGPSGDAPTETSKAADDVFTLAAAPTWAGYRFDGWLCSADGLVKAAGASYTMTAAATTFTAQWTEVDCKIYSFTGGIGSALATAAKASVETDRLFLEDSKGRIKLTPASGETFKSGDVISISGYTGNAAKKFSVKVYAANGSTEIGSMSVAAAGDINVLSTTLSADADYIYLARIDGTGQNLTTCEVHRSCAEGTTAGLSYATTEVEKTVGDAAFTNPLTNTNSLIAVYSSSDMTVATVDAKTGQVTVVGEGTTTIMAKSAVQTKSGTLYAVGTATYTLTVNPAPTYTVTYNLNGGTGTLPTQEDQEAGAVFTLHDGTTGITAPENKTFVKWKDQDDNLFNGGAEYTMPAKNVTLTAQWAGDTYTVVYKDGDDELSSEVVEVGSHPIGIEEPTKLYYEFAAWQLSGSDVELDEVTGTKDATITLTVRWAIAYAKSVDFTTSISNLTNYLSENNYFLKSTSGVSLDTSNDFDKGLKMKENNGNTLSFTVPANKRFTLTVGKINGMTIKINDGEATAIPSGTDKDHLGVTYHESYSDQTVIITETSTAYNIIRSIIITDYGVPTALDNTADEAKAVKFIENGQVVIFKDGKYFNVLGIQIR